MTDRDGLPHERIREALFWILFASWPLYFLTFWIVQEAPGPTPVELLLLIGSVNAGMTAMAYLLGKFLYQDTQRELSHRTAENGRKLGAIYDALAAVGVTRKEPLRLIRHRDPGDPGKSG